MRIWGTMTHLDDQRTTRAVGSCHLDNVISGNTLFRARNIMGVLCLSNYERFQVLSVELTNRVIASIYQMKPKEMWSVEPHTLC